MLFMIRPLSSGGRVAPRGPGRTPFKTSGWSVYRARRSPAIPGPSTLSVSDAQGFEEARNHVVGGDRRDEFQQRSRIEVLSQRLEDRVGYLDVSRHRIGEGEYRALQRREHRSRLVVAQALDLLLADAS